MENTQTIHVIKPRKGLIGIDFKELFSFRELLYFLTWRDLKVRYKQTVIGGAWAILQPFLTMIVFTVFFGKLAKIPSGEGNVGTRVKAALKKLGSK